MPVLEFTETGLLGLQKPRWALALGLNPDGVSGGVLFP